MAVTITRRARRGLGALAVLPALLVASAALAGVVLAVTHLAAGVLGRLP